MTTSAADICTWAIIGVATAGVIVRPFKLPEAVWAVVGAVLLVAFGLLPISSALAAVIKGNDVYLFLIGMMLLSETARREGLFDWVATIAVNAAKGSPKRLFALVYAVGTIVTVFLSNDATAVVLTPAVFAATTKARIEPLPFLFVCAFIANAASFVLPISNPANLVLYGSHLPALAAWLARFTIPSVLSILATYIALRFAQRDGLDTSCKRDLAQPTLSIGGRVALGGIGLTAIVLLTVSALDVPLGLPTAILGLLTTCCVLVPRRASPWPVMKEVSWAILPLVAGLFVLVEALGHTGVIATLSNVLRHASNVSETATATGAGGLIALVCNVINNLPAGLIARSTLDVAHVSQHVADSLLIGIDLGPNLSITGSLATILWLTAIRREGENVSFGRFLKVGIIVMPPALLLALCARLLVW
jgi:arsenical pump membrane protein